MATIREMGLAVHELAAYKRRSLVELEEMTYRQGIEPGPDLAFAGLRQVVSRCDEAAKFLLTLGPHEAAVREWLAKQGAPAQVEKAAATAVAA